MSKTIQFGEHVEGYTIPVLNEREIRAASGLMFLMMFISIMMAIFKADFIMLKYFVIAFLADFMIRVFINPKFAPSLILGRLIVSKQTPDYVGAKQKKFAWVIGLCMGSLMFILLNVLNSYSIITGLLCLICLVFMFFESSFGICLGCLVYRLIYRKNAQYCPGEVCERKDKQEIQKTSGIQILIVFAYIAFIVASVFLLNDSFKEAPQDLWKILDEMF